MRIKKKKGLDFVEHLIAGKYLHKLRGEALEISCLMSRRLGETHKVTQLWVRLYELTHKLMSESENLLYKEHDKTAHPEIDFLSVYYRCNGNNNPYTGEVLKRIDEIIETDHPTGELMPSGV